MPGFKGEVIKLSVFGNDEPSSAHLRFTLMPDIGPPSTCVVPAGCTPQAFAGMSALLAAAYFAGKQVWIDYDVVDESTICKNVVLSKEPRKRKTASK